jgi:hypothetical protein
VKSLADFSHTLKLGLVLFVPKAPLDGMIRLLSALILAPNTFTNYVTR